MPTEKPARIPTEQKETAVQDEPIRQNRICPDSVAHLVERGGPAGRHSASLLALPSPGRPWLALSLLASALLAAPAFGAADEEPRAWGLPEGAPSFTETFVASKDNTLCQSESGALSNGLGEYLFAGLTNQDADQRTRRALLAFDFSSAMPSDAQITAVELGLEMSLTIVGAVDTSLHRVTTDWGEGTSDAPNQEGACTAATTGDATWTSAFDGGAAWNTVGGDFDSTASATTSVAGAGDYTWSSAVMVTDVQAWVSDATTNFGWLVMADESSGTSAKRFNSRSNADVSTRPSLTVTFESAIYQVFADGFESGGVGEWSSSVGATP